MTLTPAAENIFKRLRPRKSFSKLSNEALMELCKVAVLDQGKNGSVVWNVGEPCDYCVYITGGLLEIQRASGTESETVVGIFGPSDMIGISAILKKTNYPGTARSLGESQVVKFYLRSLFSDQKGSPLAQELNAWLREMLIRHEQVLRDKIDILSAGSVDDRMYEFLKHLVRRFGKIEGSFKYSVPIELTKSKAAKMIGIRSETAIRLINHWQRSKLIDWKEREIIVHNTQMIERYVMQKHAQV